MNRFVRYLNAIIVLALSSSGLFGQTVNMGSPNINFSTGTFTGWELYEGKFQWDNDEGLYQYVWENEVTTPPDPRQNTRFKLINEIHAMDPIVNCIQGFEANPFDDSDKSIPLRIGRPNLTAKCEGAEGYNNSSNHRNRHRWAGAEMARYTFVVTEENKALILNFAAILHDPNNSTAAGTNANKGDHFGEQIPTFSISVEAADEHGNPIIMQCGGFSSSANSSTNFLQRLPRSTNCISSNALNKKPEEYLYMPWTSTVYDLTDKVGKTITITALVHDCHVDNGDTRDNDEYPYVAGSHEAYGYIAAKTVDLQLDVNYCESDNSNPTIKAPDGFYSYEWLVDGNPSPMFKKLNDIGSYVEIEKELIKAGAKYECVVRGEFSECNAISIPTTLIPSKVLPDMEYSVGCNGTVQFKNKTTAEGVDPLYSYNWSFGDSVVSVKEEPEHKYDKPGSYKLKLMGTTKNGCSGVKEFNVIVPDFPRSVISANDTLCKGEMLELSLYDVGDDVKVQWMDSTKKVISTEPDLLMQLERSAQFFTKVTDAKGCFYEDSIYIQVVPSPMVTLKATKDTVCLGDSTVIRASSLTKSNYAWSNGISGNMNKVFPISTQKYLVTATSVDYGCVSTQDIEIVVRDAMPVAIEGPTELCIGEEATLEGKNSVTYNWIVKDDQGNEMSFQGDEFKVTPTENSEYVVEGIDKNQCHSRAKHNIRVKESPKVEIAEATDRVCPDQYASVRMLAATGYSFLWHDGSNGSSLRKKIAEDEDWSVVVSWNGCTDSLKIPVYVHEMPPVTISAASEICSGDSAMVKVYAADEDKIEWLYPTDGRVVSKNTIMYAPNGNNINYQVSVTNADGCVGNANFEQKVLQPLGVQISAKSAVCYGDKLTLTAEGQGESFKWYMNDKYFDFKKVSDITIYEPAMMKVESIDKNGCISYDSTKIDTLPRPVIEVTGNMEVCKGQVAQILASGADEYVWTVDGVQKSETSHLNLLMEKERATAIVKATLQGCVSEKKVFLTSIPDPIIRINGDGIICPGDKFTLTASGGDTYKWSTGAETEEITTSATTETTYYVTGKDEKGCQATESYTVKVHKIPTIRIEQITKPGCQGEGDKVTLQAKGGIYYEWSATPEPEDMMDNAEKIQVTIFNNTHFTVKGVDENGCANTAEKEVVTVEAKKFQFDVSPKWVDESNPTVKLKGISPVEAEWTWRPHESADEHIGRTMTYTYNTRDVADSVLISVEAMDVNGCQYFGQYSLYIWKDVWAPDAFTPNKDETNEKFRFLGGKHIDKFHYIIYNRLGEIMFEGNSLEDAWDGTWKGVEQPWGIYGWVCNYNCTFNGMEKSGEKRGFVTLIR